MVELSNEALEIAEQLLENIPKYCKDHLKIKDKAGNLVPFELNKPQWFIHEKLEDQLKRKGRVRALILKGRQEGCSTYISARFFHKALWNFGTSIGTLSHLADTTNKLYQMIKRFYDNLPGILKPDLPINNPRQIRFGKIDGDWNLGTAGTDDVGRGGTLQLFHGSEVAFWKHPDKIRSGIMQAVSDMEGTESILESTANGMDIFFYQMCIQALKGQGDYELVFVPWYWMEEYQRPVEQEFSLTDEEEELKSLYKLSDQQIRWRRGKIEDLGSVEEFRKEYPCNPQEAFQTSGESFIRGNEVLKARKRRIDRNEYSYAPLIMGVDPARTSDRTVIAFRKGRKVLKVFVFDPKAKESIVSDRYIVNKVDKLDQMIIAGILARMINTYQPQLCNVDVGEGRGTIDRLHEQGFKDVVRPVLFHSQAEDNLTYANKRAEIWHRLRDWVHGEDGDVDIPDEDGIHSDICSMPRPVNTSNSRIKMVPKDEIKKKYGMSPDVAEAIALTFAFSTNATHHNSNERIRKKNAEGSKPRTLKKKRSKRDSGVINSGNIFARP